MRKNDVVVGTVVGVTVDGGADEGIVLSKDVCFATVQVYDEVNEVESARNIPYKDIYAYEA